MPLDIMCPKCHRLFSREVEEKEIVDERVYNTSQAPEFAGGGNLQDPNITSGMSVPKDLVTYKYHYKCKHCGHEWTDTKEEERSIKE